VHDFGGICVSVSMFRFVQALTEESLLQKLYPAVLLPLISYFCGSSFCCCDPGSEHS